jgi:DNA-directed RNA polymerase subunit F
MAEREKSKNLTLPQVKKLLESMGEENLDQFQRRTFDYVSKFGLDNDEAVQIVNCMPKSVEELRVFLASGRKIIEASKLQSIVNLLDEHRKLK